MEQYGFDAYTPREIAGNIAGGSVLVALVYWVVYVRGAPKP